MSIVTKGELVILSTKWPVLRYAERTLAKPFPFSGSPLILERGTPLFVIDTNHSAYQMLRNYVLCLIDRGFVWVWFTSKASEVDR